MHRRRCQESDSAERLNGAPFSPAGSHCSDGSCSNEIVYPDAPQVSVWAWYPNINTVVDSVKRTGRLVVVHEAPRTGGFAGELITLVVERAMYHLEAPPVRVTGFDTPFPYTLEMEYLPLSHRIVPAILSVVRS